MFYLLVVPTITILQTLKQARFSKKKVKHGFLLPITDQKNQLVL